MERPQYYEKTLTKTDKEEKLVLLIDWLDGRVLPIPNPGSEAIPVAFKDELGKDFVFSLKVRSLNPAKKIKVESLKPQESRGSYYMKPEFQFKEWHAFVEEKKLQVGESIYLWWDDSGHARIKVRDPPRLHRLFGTTFLY